jgi:hypothetical protein
MIDVDTWWTKRWVAFDPHSIDLDARTFLNFMTDHQYVGATHPIQSCMHSFI